MSVRLLLLLMLSGCASDRYLSVKDDADIQEKCEPQGCAIIPLPLWRKIEQLLGRIRQI